MTARRTRTRARATAAIVISTAFVAACNLLTGLDADYQLGSSTSERGEGGEGGVDGGGDAQAADAQADTRPNDDANEGDAAPSDFCAAQQGDSGVNDFFCADFEGIALEGEGFPAGWTGLQNNVDGGTLRLSADAGMDGSTALEVESNTTSTASRQTRAVKKLIRSIGKEADQYMAYELDFDFRVETSVLSYEALGLLVFGNQVPTREHGIAGYGPGQPHVLSRQAPIVGGTPRIDNDAKWHHARVRLTHAAPSMPFERTIVIDGNNLDDKPTGHTMDAGAPTELWFGVFNTSNSAGRAHAQFDNVVFRRRP
jgi:hypothetical protein